MRFQVVELHSKTRLTGYGVRDDLKGWICESYKPSKVGKSQAEGYAALLNKRFKDV